MQIIAMCSRGQEKLVRTVEEYHCHAYPSAKEMYNKETLDAVIISVSAEQHPTLVCEALDHGLHVFVEKPLALSVNEIDHMIEASSRSGKFVVVAYKKAFMPATEKALEITRCGKYPGFCSMLAYYPMALPSNGLEVLEKRTFTNWLGNGCHPLSFMLEVGGPVESLQAVTNTLGHGSIILEFKNGVIGTFYLAGGPQPNEEYHLHGDNWNLKIINSNHVVLNRGIPFEYAYTNNFAPTGDDSGSIVWETQNCLATLENKSLFVQGIIQEMMYFCQCIFDGTSPTKGSLSFARQITQLYEAALVSEGKKIKIDAGGPVNA
jgi:predicted dehydrogenase